MRNEFIENKIGFLPPDNWELTKLGKLTEVNTENISTKTDPEKEIYYIDLGSVDEGIIDLPEAPIKFKNAPSRAKRIIHEDDVLLSTVRPYLKGFAQAGGNIEGYICSTGFAVLTPEDSIDSKYVYHSLYSETFQRQFEQLLAGSSYPAINNSDVESLFLAMPKSKEERKEIVQILERWEKAVSILEKLIQSKKRYKKGLMQQLLSSKKRFPEFEDEPWVEVKLGQIFDERKEKKCSHLDLAAITTDNGVIDRDKLDRRDTSSSNKDNYKRIAPGDIGYNTMRMWQGVSGYSELQGIVSPAYTIVTPKEDKADGLFMSYLFKHPPIIDLFRRYSQGLVSDTLNLKYANFSEIKVTIPQSLKEQRKIRNVLMTADEEIDLLNKKLDAIKNQKKGLMQKLLTGKVRVNEELTKAESYG